ncbi:MAG: SUMF1/EgtB/PvdO family nonheme iron enzyme [Bacteroidales bacterium]|nr:SUMF1/EgtB/PvdO family nonheme iron enzyme [Bacteroidales bacterium]
MRKYRYGSNRVVRGGSWNNTAFNCTMSNRSYYNPDIRSCALGFRLVLVP